MKNNKVCIVLGNDHYNTLNVVRSLGEAKIQVLAIIISDKPTSFVLKSKYIYRGEVLHNPDVADIINKYATSEMRIPILATCDSLAAFLDQHYDTLSKHFILPSVGNTQGMLIHEMDKNIQLKHAEKAGFDIPKSVAISLDNVDTIDLSDIIYPCLIKPEESIGGSKSDFRICNTEKELRERLLNLSQNLHRVLVQQFIPNNHVMVISGVRTINNINYVFGEIDKFKHGNQLHNLGLNCMGVLSPISELRNTCISYVDAIDYHGCYSIDIVRVCNQSTSAQNQNYFMEINLRTDGLLYFYRKAGINFPAIWVNSCYNEKVNVTPSHNKIYGMNEFMYFRHCLSAAVFTDLFKTDIFSTFSLKDIKPFIYRFLYHG